MKSTDIRELRTQFRTTKAGKERVHARTKPASLIVNNADDPTTMFNTAGMQQFVPYLVGKPHPLGKRLYNIQGCIRTNDIEEVGDVSHLTFFEMMGNRSLGDYFKQEAITWSWEFLTSADYLGLDSSQLAVSVFAGDADAPKDEESADIRKAVGVASDRITYLGKADNRRGPAGKVGPCGPDTEIFYWIGEGEVPTTFDPEKDDKNRLEIWNNVFMSYYKDESGSFTELEHKNVDTGMGFERICMIMQGVDMKSTGKIEKLSDLSVYSIDIFQDMLTTIALFMEYDYPLQISTELDAVLAKSYRVVADHLRTAIFLIDAGLTPSNEGRGYVLRRILRRAYYHLMKIHPEGSDWFANKTINKVIMQTIHVLENHYLHLGSKKEATAHTIYEERKQFQLTLNKGSKKYEEMLTRQLGKIFSGKDAFILYDTYGVPVELTAELVEQHGLTVDMKGFYATMEEAKKMSRAGGQKKFDKGIDRATYIDGLPPTVFVGYEQLEDVGSKILKDFTIGEQRYLVLDRSPFYAESGGQRGDSGILELDDGSVLHIIDVQKYGGVWLHMVG